MLVSEPDLWIEPTARRHGISDDDIRHALAHPGYVGDDHDALDEDTPMTLILGPDRAGNRLELAALVADEGDGGRRSRHVHASEVRTSVARRMEVPTMTTKRPPLTIGGRSITDELVEKAAEQAEVGLDTEHLVRRPGGRPLLGSAPAGNISVRFPPDLRHQLRARAQAERVAEAEVIRRAVHDYLERPRAS